MDIAPPSFHGAITCSSSADSATLKINGDRMPPWGGAGVSVALLAEFGEHTGLEERLDQGQHAFVLDARPHSIENE
ncbi:hypothetical protein MRBLMF1_007502, partial [Streptomyces ossamyceticus]